MLAEELRSMSRQKVGDVVDAGVIRKLIETLFGDGKQHGATIRQVKLRGLAKVSEVFTLSMLAVNLRRLPKLMAMPAMAGSG